MKLRIDSAMVVVVIEEEENYSNSKPMSHGAIPPEL